MNELDNMSGKNTKVYLVVSGEHDDYAVNAVFSTKDRANAYAEELNRQRNNPYRIAYCEDYVLDNAPAIEVEEETEGELIMNGLTLPDYGLGLDTPFLKMLQKIKVGDYTRD